MLNFLIGLVLIASGQTYVCKPGEVLDYLTIGTQQTPVSNTNAYSCRIRGSGLPGINGVTVFGDHNGVYDMVIERMAGAGVVFFSGTDGTAEGNTVRDFVPTPGNDNWAFYVGEGTRGTFNIRYNKSPASGFTMYAPNSTAIVEYNEFVVTEDMHTDCQGHIQRDGPCQCAEFGIAHKNGKLIARYNVIDGYKQSDPICGGSGAYGIGIATAACGGGGPFPGNCRTVNAEIEANTIKNVITGIYISPNTVSTRVQGNLICYADVGIQDGYGISTQHLDNSFFQVKQLMNLYGVNAGKTFPGNRMVASCQ